METLNGDFYLPCRILTGPGSRKRFSDLLGRYTPTAAAIIGDPTTSQNSTIAALGNILEAQGVQALFTLIASTPPLTPKIVAEGARQFKNAGVGLKIAVGGSGAMACAAHFSREASHPKPFPTILIPTTPMAAMTALLPQAMAWDPVREKMAITPTGEGYPEVMVLDPEWCLNTVRIHPTDPGLAPLSLSMEALLQGNGDPFVSALATEAIRRLRPRILPAAGGTEDGACWVDLLMGGLMAGLAYGRCGTARGWSLAQALAHVYHLNSAPLVGMLLPEILRGTESSAVERIQFLASLVGTCWPSPVATGRQFLDCALRGSRHSLPTPLDSIQEWVRETVRESAPGELEELGRYARRKAHRTLDNFQFIDEWRAKQTLQTVATDLQTLNRQAAFLMDRPLNLRNAGVDDNLAKLTRVVAVAREIYDQMAPQGSLEDRNLEDLIYAAFRTRQTPLEVDPEFLD